MTRGYLISDGFRDRIERTIERVAGAPYGGGVTNVTPRLESVQAGAAKVFRICTYTGAWSIGDTKAVTFKYQSSTPNTVSATNLFFPITNTATGSRDCAVAKDGANWVLVDVRAYVTATSVVTDISLSAVLNTSSCTINVSRTLTTAIAHVVQFGV